MTTQIPQPSLNDFDPLDYEPNNRALDIAMAPPPAHLYQGIDMTNNTFWEKPIAGTGDTLRELEAYQCHVKRKVTVETKVTVEESSFYGETKRIKVKRIVETKATRPDPTAVLSQKFPSPRALKEKQQKLVDRNEKATRKRSLKKLQQEADQRFEEKIRILEEQTKPKQRDQTISLPPFTPSNNSSINSINSSTNSSIDSSINSSNNSSTESSTDSSTVPSANSLTVPTANSSNSTVGRITQPSQNRKRKAAAASAAITPPAEPKKRACIVRLRFNPRAPEGSGMAQPGQEEMPPNSQNVNGGTGVAGQAGQQEGSEKRKRRPTRKSRQS